MLKRLIFVIVPALTIALSGAAFACPGSSTAEAEEDSAPEVAEATVDTAEVSSTDAEKAEGEKCDCAKAKKEGKNCKHAAKSSDGDS